jgi:outer membrane protein
MTIRTLTSILATVLLTALVAPAAIGADLTDVGYLDQAQLAGLPVFVSSNRALAAYKAQLDAQFASQVRSLKTDAERQQLALSFQQQLSDKQREIVGPLFQRAQLAIAQVAATKNLSVVVDKRIIIYGGQDITKDVEALFSGAQAINPPTATPPPSEIGFVDQNALDQLPKVKAADDQMAQYEQQQRAIFGPQAEAAKGDQAKAQQIAQQYQKAIDSKRDELLNPLVDASKSATAQAARKHGLLLVVDRGDVLYGGTDITTDVQNALGK